MPVASKASKASNPKLALVIGMGGVKWNEQQGWSARCCSIWQLSNSTFVRLSKAPVNVLRIVEPEIGWGTQT